MATNHTFMNYNSVSGGLHNHLASPHLLAWFSGIAQAIDILDSVHSRAVVCADTISGWGQFFTLY